MTWGPRALIVAVWALCLVGVSMRAQGVAGDTGALLSRVGEYVEAYYSQAQSMVAVETVTIQNVGRDMAGDGFPRRFVYNLRVEWTPAGDGPPDAQLTRELVSVNGRPPKAGDEPHCTAPRPITPEPLAMFLRPRQGDFIFDRSERTELDRRAATRLDYRLRRPEPDVVSWDRECVSMSFPARLRGRVWIDERSGEVLRLDEGSTGPVEVVPPREQQRRGAGGVLVFERFSVSIRYRAVTFREPDETLLLPASIDSLTMARHGGTRRIQTYSGYRRFVTEGRLVP